MSNSFTSQSSYYPSGMSLYVPAFARSANEDQDDSEMRHENILRQASFEERMLREMSSVRRSVQALNETCNCSIPVSALCLHDLNLEEIQVTENVCNSELMKYIQMRDFPDFDVPEINTLNNFKL